MTVRSLGPIVSNNGLVSQGVGLDDCGSSPHRPSFHSSTINMTLLLSLPPPSFPLPVTPSSFSCLL